MHLALSVAGKSCTTGPNCLANNMSKTCLCVGHKCSQDTTTELRSLSSQIVSTLLKRLSSHSSYPLFNTMPKTLRKSTPKISGSDEVGTSKIFNTTERSSNAIGHVTVTMASIGYPAGTDLKLTPWLMLDLSASSTHLLISRYVQKQW